MCKCCIYLIKGERRRGGRVNRPRLQNSWYDRNKLPVAAFSTKMILRKMTCQVEGGGVANRVHIGEKTRRDLLIIVAVDTRLEY